MSSGVRFKPVLNWTARVATVHFVTYLAFGIVFFNLLGYASLYESADVAAYMRSTTDPVVTAGPLFQLIRGPIIGVALYPFRRVFLAEKRGWMLLWGLLLALMVVAPAGAAPGSIEGLVYTEIPLWFHAVSLPEVVLQTLVFSWMLVAWERRAEKKTP